jgi:hypothetical protein
MALDTFKIRESSGISRERLEKNVNAVGLPSIKIVPSY